jgi:hypothetical protein
MHENPLAFAASFGVQAVPLELSQSHTGEWIYSRTAGLEKKRNPLHIEVGMGNVSLLLSATTSMAAGLQMHALGDSHRSRKGLAKLKIPTQKR